MEANIIRLSSEIESLSITEDDRPVLNGETLVFLDSGSFRRVYANDRYVVKIDYARTRSRSPMYCVGEILLWHMIKPSHRTWFAEMLAYTSDMSAIVMRRVDRVNNPNPVDDRMWTMFKRVMRRYQVWGDMHQWNYIFQDGVPVAVDYAGSFLAELRDQVRELNDRKGV